MPHKCYPIKGIHEGLGPGNQVPIRREVTEWRKSEDPIDQMQVILFLLALRRFQAVPPYLRDSYFQIAGIHGMPYTSWDEPSTTNQETHRKGYCVHANSLFPPWHRPYLLLYEQRIHEIMVKEIIPEMGLSQDVADQFRKAASTWRLPFWDWAKNPKMPDIFHPRKFSIKILGIEIDNPLYQFKMPNGKKMGAYGVGNLKSPDSDEVLEYGECIATSRCPKPEERVPTSEAWRDGVAHHETVDNFLTEHKSVTDFDYGKTAEMVYRLLTYPMDFVSFATTARDAGMDSSSDTKVTNDMNLEFIHNNIHYWVGGDGGHMSQIPVATFDPIFWFHHCNLDRLYAIWQTLNPDNVNPNNWFNADKMRPFDQKIIGKGNIVISQAPLQPFHKDEGGTVWTPDDGRDWFKLGYTYPELQRWTYGTNQRDVLFRDITEMYGISRQEALQMAKPDSELPGTVEIKANGTVSSNDYAVSIKYSKFAMGGHSFNLEVYLRPEGETKNEFRTEDFVTNVFNFSQPPEQDGQTVCSNCEKQKEQDVQVIAYIPLTSYLVKKIKQQQLKNLEPVTVEKFLAGIYWRLTMNGKPVPEDKWKDNLNLKVGVSETKMDYSKDPGVKTEFNDPKVIPSLGTGIEGAQGSGPTPGVSANLVSLNGSMAPLKEAVSVGGSIVITSPSIKVDIPRRETRTGISLLYLDASTGDVNDLESYDVLLNMVILSKLQVLECNSKPARHGFGTLTELKPLPWFQSENPKIRVDIGAGEFVVYVDGRRIGTVKRAITKGNVTHVRYFTLPVRAESVMAKDIRVTTYQQANLVS